jgi:regulator of cell morphogenesis and NO signaling
MAGTAARNVAGGAIALDETVDMVAKRVPGAGAALRELGIDTCCGGGLTLAQAASSAGIPVERLLAALRERGGAP